MTNNRSFVATLAWISLKKELILLAIKKNNDEKIGEKNTWNDIGEKRVFLREWNIAGSTSTPENHEEGKVGVSNYDRPAIYQSEIRSRKIFREIREFWNVTRFESFGRAK